MTDVAPHKTGQAGQTRQRVFLSIITIVVLVVIFVWVIPRFGDYESAWAVIKSLPPSYAVLLGLVTLLALFLYILPLQAALPGLPFIDATMIRQSSYVASNTVPAGGAIALGMQYRMLTQAGFGGPPASAAVGLVTLFNLIVTLAMPVLGGAALLLTGDAGSRETWGVYIGLGGLCLVIGFCVLMFRKASTAQALGDIADRLIRGTIGRFMKNPPSGLGIQLVHFRSVTVAVVEKRWVELTVTSLLQQFSQALVLIVALLATGALRYEHNTVLHVFAAFGVAWLATFLPITPGGLGTVDAGLVGLLVAFGVKEDQALAGVLLWRALSWVPQVLFGLIGLALWRFRYRHLNNSQRETALAVSEDGAQ